MYSFLINTALLVIAHKQFNVLYLVLALHCNECAMLHCSRTPSMKNEKSECLYNKSQQRIIGFQLKLTKGCEE